MRFLDVETLPRQGQINCLKSTVDKHNQKPEITAILAILTAYQAEHDVIEKYNLYEYTDDELVDYISAFLSFEDPNSESVSVWNMVIDVLSVARIADVIENANDYITRFLKASNLAKDVKRELLKGFMLDVMRRV